MTAAEEYREALAHLFRLRRFGAKPGLEVMRELLGALGNPQESLRAIHVAGSKGKGSVAAIAAGLLQATGRRTALYTSPHLVSYRERAQVDRAPIDREAVVDGLRRVADAESQLRRRGRIDREATFFEQTTALAFGWFRDRGATDAVIEVGLGGRLDATNLLESTVGVVSSIELEHTDVLGATREQIAREKAGIFHAGMDGVLGLLPDDAGRAVEATAGPAVSLWRAGRELRVLERAADPRGQRLVLETPYGRREGLHLPLIGAHQGTNAAVALGAVERHLARQGGAIDDVQVRRGLAHVLWRARLERLSRRPELYLDVAHTPGSAEAARAALAEVSPLLDPDGGAVLFGCLADKNAEEILATVSALAATCVVVPVGSSRTADPAELARRARGHFRRVVQAPDAATGFALARAALREPGIGLVLGSDYLAGEILRLVEGTPSDEPDLSDPGVGPAGGVAEPAGHR